MVIYLTEPGVRVIFSYSEACCVEIVQRRIEKRKKEKLFMMCMRYEI